MLKIKDNIYYVGKASDNAYLITGEKNALIETVTDEYAEAYIQNIESVMAIGDIDYLIFTHTEPRCLKSVEKIIEKNPDIEIIGTIPTVKNLKEIINSTFNERIAKNNSVLELGADLTLHFTVSPNLPCPDSMLVFLENSDVLFSGHLFTPDFENNLMPFRPFVAKALEKIPASTAVICPCRGSIISSSAKECIEKYAALVNENTPKEKTAVICRCAGDGYTAKMADIIAEELSSNGINVKLIDAETQGIAKTLNSADALIFGTPTIHRNARKEIWNAVTDLNAVSVNGKPYFVFGSYGWSGEGIQLIHEHLKMLRMKPFSKPFGVLFNPSKKDIAELKDLAKRFAQELENIYN